MSIVEPSARSASKPPVFEHGSARLYMADCIDWLHTCEPNSIQAVVTDPPYGIVEYTADEQAKLRAVGR